MEGLRRPGDRLLPGRDRLHNGWDVVRPVKPTGIAKSLAIGNPADGPYVLDVVRRTGGAVGDVSDDEIARGHPCCWPGPRASSPRPPAASPSRCCGSWSRPGSSTRTQETVVLNTGEGLKTLDPLEPVVGPDPPRASRR